MSALTDLVDQAILKYGGILEAPEDCDEFLKIREMSPDEDKTYSFEYKERMKNRLIRFVERDNKILDLIEEGYTAEMVADEMGIDVSTVRVSAKRNGVTRFGRYLLWYAEKNGIKYYSERRIDLEQRKFKPREIKRVKLLKFELPDRAHYCSDKKWHIKKRKD